MSRPAHGHHAVRFLPPSTGSLARQIPPGVPGDVLYVLGDHGGVRVDPTADEFDPRRHQVVLGRDDTEALVHVGAGDPEVSRRQGLIFFDGRRWILQNTGKLEIRLPVSRRLGHDDDVRLPHAYYPIFLDTPQGGRTYVVEIRVTRRNEPGPADAENRGLNNLVTVEEPEGAPDPSLVKPEDRLVVVALGQRYLLHLDHPQPLSRKQVAAALTAAAPDTTWTERAVDNRLARIRERLIALGVQGLRASEFDDPDTLGNTINHNLVTTLVNRGAITSKDLRLLGPDHRA